MSKAYKREDFTPKTKDIIAKRAAYLCSNPNCRNLTIEPSKHPDKYIYTGRAAHITAAATNGPRYDQSLPPAQRSSISNGIYLCANCADMVDKNMGLDFPADLLRHWKNQHEIWIKNNKSSLKYQNKVIINGEHIAKGIGEVTALDIQRPAIIKPGTKSIAEGHGDITATRISNRTGKENE